MKAVYFDTLKPNKERLEKLLALQAQIEKCGFQKDSCYMFVLQKIGFLYFKQSDYAAAIDRTKQSVLAAKECIKNKSCTELALAQDYYNLYYYYVQTGQLQNKYRAIDSCVASVLKANSGFDMAIRVLANKIDYLFNKGEYDLCIKNAKLAEELTQKYYHQKDSIDLIISFSITQASSLYYGNNFASAEDILKAKINDFKTSGHENLLGPFYTLLGSISADKKNYTQALSYFQQVYKIYSVPPVDIGLAQCLSNIGNLYSKYFHNDDAGLKYCGKALKYADASDSLFTLRLMGRIYASQKNFDKAQHYFQLAFNTVSYGMNERTLLLSSFEFPAFNQLQDLSDLVTEKGDAFVQQYYYTKNEAYLKAAIDVYKKNDLFLTKIKSDQQLQLSSNLVWRTTARNLYEHAIKACYANNNIADAFYFFEKSRAILLNDQINEQRWMTDTDIAKQAAIKKEIAGLEKALAGLPPSSDEYLAIQKKIYLASAELASSIQHIQVKNPSYYKNYLDTAFITISQLRRTILTNSKTLVEIFSGDSSVYVLTVTPNKETLNKIDLQLFDSLSASFNSYLRNPEAINKNYPAFIQTAARLYQLIFSKNTPPPGGLIISPGGKSFPFEALVMDENQQQPSWLLNRYAISYTYSANYLTNQFAAASKTSNAVLGIAPVTYKNYGQLATLYGSDNSLQKINHYYSTATSFTLNSATRSNFLQHFPEYSIIQLYTHAAETSSNNEPVIYFADSALYLSDLITDRKPVTQLVVLSACETANGKLYEGEGIFSFNRAFAAMGVPAAVSNLWSVSNESTYRITELFYKFLAEGLPTDIALQKAKMEFVKTAVSKEQTMPYYWAGIILTGKVETLKNSSSVNWLLLSFIAVALLSVIFFGGKWYLKTKRKTAFTHSS